MCLGHRGVAEQNLVGTIGVREEFQNVMRDLWLLALWLLAHPVLRSYRSSDLS